MAQYHPQIFRSWHLFWDFQKWKDEHLLWDEKSNILILLHAKKIALTRMIWHIALEILLGHQIYYTLVWNMVSDLYFLWHSYDNKTKQLWPITKDPLYSAVSPYRYSIISLNIMVFFPFFGGWCYLRSIFELIHSKIIARWPQAFW